MNNEQENAELKVKTRKKPVRSRYPFPSYDLGVARQIAEKVEYEGAGRLSEGTLAITLHASAKSSGFRLKVLTARQFQLLTKEREMLSTTPLAKAILKPATEEEKRTKIIEAFMAIPLFYAVATRFSGQPLPTSQSFRNILEREFGVESNRVSEAERVLTDSAREAGILYQSGDKTYLTTEIMPGTKPPTPPGTQGALMRPPEGFVSPPGGEVTPKSSGLLTVSEQDLEAFDDKDFNEIWSVLGKIVRARSKKKRLQEEQLASEEIEEEEKE